MVKSAYEPSDISGWSLSRFPKHETSALTMSNEVDNAYDMYQLRNFRNWIKKTGKNTDLCQKAHFWPNVHEICVCHSNFKNDKRTIYITKFPQTNEQVQKKFQPVRVDPGLLKN